MTHPLSADHRKMLEEGSGIVPEVIATRGYLTLTRPQDVEALGFAEFQVATARAAPVLAIPLWTVQGQQEGWQIRPDKPRIATDKKKQVKKAAKYETPYQGQVSLDVHPHVQPLLRDPTVPLWVTEGVKKGDALASRGACAIALMGGVWGFKLPEWEHVALAHRSVRIVFDSDVMEKVDVKKALQALVTYLAELEPTVQVEIASLPSADSDKVGVDDFLLHHSLQELEGLLAAPRQPPAKRAKAPPALPTTTTAGDPAAQLGTVSPCTHVANAKRLIARYQPTLRYVLGLGWILWTGQFWRPDPTKDDALATGFVSGLALTIAEEAATLFVAAAQTPSATERKALYALALERGRWAVHSEQRRTIAGGLALAKHALLLDHEQINPNPWLFNCQNGTLDLKTGHLKPHDPTDLITHLAPVTYDPKATCPTWEQFLGEVFAQDQTMVDFVQRAIGSSLTGVVQDRALFLLYGAQGHNGKTTLVEVIRDLLGTSGEEGFGYARKVDVMTFMKSKNYEDNLRKAAQLAGARFVYSSEIDEEHRLNEQLIKDMTGGDTMEARHLYKEAFNFKPTFKPWMYGNHKPEIRGTDDALWSRPKLIEFPVSFADRVDHALPQKLRAELSGILTWAMAGCLTWQREGLGPPAKVQAATQSYRQEQDVIGQFLAERCDTGDDYVQCKASRLYAAYQRWGEENGHIVLSQKRFGTYLTVHGYPSDNNETGLGAVRKRIDLKSIPEADTDESLPFTTLRPQRVEPVNANNGATKSSFTPSNTTLSTLTLGNPIERVYLEGFPETKGRKGSNSPSHENYGIKKQEDIATTLSKAKGSDSAPTRGSLGGAVSPSYCPGCARPSTWLLRGGREVCYKCGTDKPQRTEGLKA